jgi:ABC-2 type transport system permease protein
MNKFWLVCRHEYLRHVKTKRFIFALLSLPFFILLTMGIGILAVALQYNSLPVGYIDQSGVLANAEPVITDTFELFPTVKIQAFAAEPAARAALDAKEIQAYFIVAPDYMKTGMAKAVVLENLRDNARNDFRDFIRHNLLRGRPQELVDRLINGPSMTIQSLDGSRSLAENQVFSFIVPLICGVLFMVAINISGSYLIQALVEEKENRTMEIVITSVSSDQLMAGKILGNMAVGLTQLIIWIAVGLLGLNLFGRISGDLPSIDLDPGFLLLSLTTLLLAYVLVAAIMAAIGATAVEAQEAQQVAGLFTMPIFIPYWFISPIMYSPNSPLAVGLSLFPLTAPITLPLRAAFTTVPVWQMVLSLALMLICALVAIWLAGRAFRLGMLRYGKQISLRELFRKQVVAK